MIAIVTGSTSGIGKSTATELARRGNTVVMIARNPELAKKNQGRNYSKNWKPECRYFDC